MSNQQSGGSRSAWRGIIVHTLRAADSVWLSGSVDSTNSVIARTAAAQDAGRPLDERVRTLFLEENVPAEPSAEPILDSETAALADLTRRADVDYEANNADAAAAWLASVGLTPNLDELPVQVPVSVAIADTQTSGRGRLGRAWYNKAGESFIASYAVAVPKTLAVGPDSGWLTMIAGLAAIDALGSELTNGSAHELDPEARFALKWPNDIFLIGRKLGGILTELTELDDQWAMVTFGIGLNLFVEPDELPTEESTSLQLHYAPLPPYGELRDRLAAGVATALRVRLSAFASYPDRIVGRLHGEVVDLSWTLGRRVKARLAEGGEVIGVAQSINDDASLTVEVDDGTERIVTTGDVGVLPND